MRAFLFLVTVFLCTGSFIATEVTVIGVASSALGHRNGLGAGVGVFFCVLGTFLASIGLRYFSRWNVRLLAMYTTIVTYVSTGFLWGLYKYVPLLMLSYIAAVIYSAIYIILNYCLCVSVYQFDQHTQRDRLAKQLAFPVFTAQAIIPLVSGWVLDTHGVGMVAVLIILAYSVPLVLVVSLPENKPAKVLETNMKISTLNGVPGIILHVSAISSFALNWYFSSALTMLASQNVSALFIGEIMSALNVAGVIGVGLLSAASINHMRHQVVILFVSSLILFPAIMLAHSMYGFILSLGAAALFITTGLLTGVAGALVNSIKFKMFDERTYGHYHRFLTILTIISALIGCLIGAIVTSRIGWGLSLIICIMICLLLSIKPTLSIFLNRGKLN